jgi:hypothetical protein
MFEICDFMKHTTRNIAHIPTAAPSQWDGRGYEVSRSNSSSSCFVVLGEIDKALDITSATKCSFPSIKFMVMAVVYGVAPLYKYVLYFS